MHVPRCRHAGACFRCLCTQQLGLGTPVVKFAEFYVSAQAHKSVGGRGTAEQRPPPSDQASPYPGHKSKSRIGAAQERDVCKVC